MPKYSEIQTQEVHIHTKMDTLQAQKENVDANFGGKAGDSKLRFSMLFILTLASCPLLDNDKFSTPKRGFVIHEDCKSASNKGLKDSSSKKSRRVLGDISNKQRNRHDNSDSGTIVSIKKAGLGKGLGHSKKLIAKKRTPLRPKLGTPLAPKEPASSTPKPHTKVSTESVIKVSSVEEVPDIEYAYGGLSPPTAYAEEMSREIEDLLNDKTPTLFDSFESTRDADNWDDSIEKAMLESGEPPSSWWASPEQTKTETEGADNATTNEKKESEVEDDLSELPPPDNLPDTDFDDDGLLDDILNVDFETACGE
ncbi:hypothetical protein P3T76_006726 [Phytophthora citrophthora]|uniref:Uncharacterized protein n=1 Tax=Phytophthora citrophthora TaxID=4793 RepID=A0AAD9LNC1_9STRA|nr:hypothetical protein P3T76_006726 [Phytophthora citrophthora]